MKYLNKKAEKIIISVTLIIIAGLVMNIGYAVGMVLPVKNKSLIELITLVVSAPLGFVIVPSLLNNFLNFFNAKLKFNFIQAIILVVIILTASIFLLHSDEILHDFIIATCEEFLFRFIIFNVLRTEYSRLFTYLIGSFLFGTLLHLNGNFLINFVTKVPAGFFLYFLSDRFGLQSSIAFHWFYNILVGYFFG